MTPATASAMPATRPGCVAEPTTGTVSPITIADNPVVAAAPVSFAKPTVATGSARSVPNRR